MESAWKDSELEAIADDLRERITGGRAVTISDYVGLAESKSVKELGRLNIWIARNEPSIKKYLPSEVVEVISGKIRSQLYASSDLLDFLRKNKYLGINILTRKLRTNKYYLMRRAAVHNIQIPGIKDNSYSNFEIELISSMLEESDKIIAQRIGRSVNGIYAKRRRLGLRKSGKRFEWKSQKAADRYLKKTYFTRSYREIAEYLGLDYGRVLRRVHFLHLKKRKTAIFNWDAHPEAKKYLLDNYLISEYSEIAKKLGVTYNQVKTMIRKLGLKKKLIRSLNYG